MLQGIDGRRESGEVLSAGDIDLEGFAFRLASVGPFKSASLGFFFFLEKASGERSDNQKTGQEKRSSVHGGHRSFVFRLFLVRSFRSVHADVDEHGSDHANCDEWQEE